MAQATRKKPHHTRITFKVQSGLRTVILWICIALALDLMLALFTYNTSDPGWLQTAPVGRYSNFGGVIGAYFADITFIFFGYLGYLLPILLCYGAWLFYSGANTNSNNDTFHPANLALSVIGLLLMFASGSGLATLQVTKPWWCAAPVYLGGQSCGAGGVLGELVGVKLAWILGYAGASVFLLGLFFAGITLFTGISWTWLVEWLGQSICQFSGVWEQYLHRFVSWAMEANQQREARRTVEVSTYTEAAELPSRSVEVRIEPSFGDLIGSEENISAVSEPIPITVTSLFAPPVPEIILNTAINLHNSHDIQLNIDSADEDAITLPPVPEVKEYHLPARDYPSKPTPAPLPKPTSPPSRSTPLTVVTRETRATSSVPRRPKDAHSDVAPPSLGLLDTTSLGRVLSLEAIEQLSRMVEACLADFNVDVQVVGVQPGPVITRVELQPAPGVKVNQITNLSKDIARSLSVTSVRVAEVIPGRPTVGLEIPNDHREVVALGEVLRSLEYEQCNHILPLALGKDIGGKPVVVDLQRMPHLLVAGTTGSGKSVGMNAMVLSLLYKLQPSQVRLIMVDPKMLELSVYQGIPHLLAPVVTDMKEAANALRWCVAEMDQRYRLMASLGVRNIAGFNRKVSDAITDELPLIDPLRPNEVEPATLTMLPYIVVLIDELADLMMVVGKKVEELIARLAQKARAAGIHLIIATQRPSVDVITGLIKANIPTRIAFQVSSRIDSRIILDQQGAETLLGHGDMLYLPPGTGVPIRIHGAFVSDQEVHRIAEDLKARGAPNYIEDVLQASASEGSDSNSSDLEGDPEDDPLFDEAVRIITETRRASVSGIQRRLKIGYNRAARLVEVMESCGVVGPLQSNGTREVLRPAPTVSAEE